METSLIDRYRNGDSEAGWELVMSQLPLIKSLAGKLNLPRSVDYEDVVSEMQLKVYADIAKYDPELAGMATFVYKVFWANVADVIKSLRGAPNSVPVVDICVYQDEQEQTDNRELLFVISDAMSKASPLHQKVFAMWCQDASAEQIAAAANETLGMSEFNENSARRLVSDSIQVVRNILEQEIASLDD